MGLPKITFNIANDGLGLSGDGVEKVPGLLITGASVVDKVQVGQSYQIFSLSGAEALGIDQENNPFAYKHLKAFYEEDGQGAELWFMLVSDATTYEQMTDSTANLLKKLISDAGGKIRIVGLLKKSTGAAVVEEGIDKDVKLGVVGGQSLAQAFAESYMPFSIVISGNDFDGSTANLFDFSEAEFDRVSMLIANNDGAPEASIGLALGRLARIPSQRSLARVKDGSAIALQAYFTNGEKVESLTDAWDTIHDMGYIFFRSFPGRAGYYFTDDQTLSKPTTDFYSLGRRLVMDEAILIANDTLTEELSDEIPVAENGNIHPAIIKSWQTNVESQINNLMVSLGKLNGVSVLIDPAQNILSSNKLQVGLRLQPVGYAKQIEINIGYTVNLQE